MIYLEIVEAQCNDTNMSKCLVLCWNLCMIYLGIVEAQCNDTYVPQTSQSEPPD